MTTRVELITMVRALAAEGLTGAQIAKRLPIEKSRSAIHGLCFREGIKLRNGHRGPDKGTTKKPQPEPKPDLTSRFRPRIEPRCVWHGCAAPPIKGKPYCEVHKDAIRNGVMRRANA